MLYINGRFLTQKITGVQRYAIEIVKELDKTSKSNEIVLLCPNDYIINTLNLKNIQIKKIGKLKGHMWEQISLPFYMLRHKGKLLNLCNIGPILFPGYITIHDISFKSNPNHLNKKMVLWYRFITKLNIKRYKHIFTVSNFSKNEIMHYYKINDNKITITFNSANHMKNIKKNDDILKKLNIFNKDFYFSLGSNSKHKNFAYIYNLAKKYQDKLFVVTGNDNCKVFENKEEKMEKLENLIYTGYLSDEELASLYANCKAFIFPSLYEGFGIPPLEAVIIGCDHLILSNIEVLKEIYGENAIFFDSSKEANLPTKLKKANRNLLTNLYSWEKSAKIINDIITKN